jgi:hypothetical protein
MTITAARTQAVDVLEVTHATHESESTVHFQGKVVLTRNRHRAFERYSLYLELDTKGSHVLEIMFIKEDDAELFERAKAVMKGSTATVGVGVILVPDGTRMYRARNLIIED